MPRAVITERRLTFVLGMTCHRKAVRTALRQASQELLGGGVIGTDLQCTSSGLPGFVNAAQLQKQRRPRVGDIRIAGICGFALLQRGNGRIGLAHVAVRKTEVIPSPRMVRIELHRALQSRDALLTAAQFGIAQAKQILVIGIAGI